MHYYFKNEISEETINSLISVLSSTDDKIELWFTTNGGCTSSMEFLIEYLNLNKNRIKITLSNRVLSAGTFILLDFEGDIKIKNLDFVTFHLADRESYTLRKDKHLKKLSKMDWEYNLKIAEKIKNKNLLNEKQLKKLLKGKDVTIYKKQIEEWKI